MIRFSLAMLFYVVVARWSYAEIQLAAPSLLPVVDSVLAHVQIPTHDKWPREAFKHAMGEVIAAWNAPSPEHRAASGTHNKGSREFGWDIGKDSLSKG